MLAPTTTTNASLVATDDRNGATGALFRSEPTQSISLIADQSSTTAEKYKDKVTLSADGLKKSRNREADSNEDSTSVAGDDSETTRQSEAQQLAPELTAAEQKAVQQLQERDQEVKAHEMAHLANAGQYARGGPTYSYQQGPDGRRYAIGGEVPIDISKEQTPEQTVQKMQTVKRAALAPAEPSSADRNIAAAATAMESQARQELRHAPSNPADNERARDDHAHPAEESPESSARTDSAPRRRLMHDVFA